MRLLLAFLLLVIPPPPPSAAEDELPAPDGPREAAIVERTEARLAQLDVSVLGPADRIADLTADDFDVRINFRRLDAFELDRLCPAASQGPPARAAPADEPTSAARGPSPTYLFYFDQPLLTLGGRQRALDLARELVPRLIRNGARGLIVSNASDLVLIEPRTDDPDRLLGAIERLERDRAQWDVFAERENFRVGEVVRVLNESEDIRRAIALARTYQKEERWRIERNLRRLELTLGRLVEVDAPKAVIYFADILRSNPGEHYLSFFGSAVRRLESTLGVMESDSISSRLPFDAVVNRAAEQGIRFYTIEARGLVNHMDLGVINPAAMNQTGIAPTSSRVRVHDAQEAMESLAGETGGEAFLHGVNAERIGDRILEDSSCVYLLSFDPGDLREDVALRVSVKVDRPGVRVRSRGRLVIPSESSRATERMLSAFGMAGEFADAPALRIGMIPLGFRNGAYDALLQLAAPGTPLPSATWDLGSSLVSSEKVRDEASGRIQIDRPGVVVVLERQVKVKPGAYEVVSVAHENASGLVLSDDAEFEWPPLRAGEVALGPIALLQPVSGAFLRDGETRTRGSLSVGDDFPASTALPSALVGLVCPGRRIKESLRVERVLIGRRVRTFDPQLLDLDDERCVQVRDVLPEGSLAPGYYRYELRVVGDKGVLAEASREFYAQGATDAPASPAPGDAPATAPTGVSDPSSR